MTLIKDKKKLIAEILFLLSYFFLIIGLGRFFRPIIFNGDAFRIGLVLHLLGILLGGSKLGGRGLINFISPFISRFSLKIFVYIVWSSAWGGIALIKHFGLHTGDFDVGIFGQTLLSISQGLGYLQFPDVPQSYLGVHQNFTLPLFAPFFWTPYGTELLLFTQPFFFFAPGLFFSYWIQKYLKNTPHSLLWSWLTFYMFLTASTVTRNTLWEWHETVFTYPALCLWMWALCFKNLRIFIISGLIAGLTKENILVTLIPGILLYPFIHYKTSIAFSKKTQNFIICIFLAFLHLFIFGLERKYLAELNFSTLRYDWLGHSFYEILKTLLYQPDKWISELFSEKRIYFVKSLLESSGWVSLLSGPFILSWLAPLFAHLLSNREAQYMIHYHYALEIWPLIAVSTLWVWVRFSQNFPQYEKKWLLLSAFLVLSPVSENILERTQQHLPDMKANFPVIQEMRVDLLNLKKSCHGNIRGMASQWSFSHFFQDIPNLYPTQTLVEMKPKFEFNEIFLNPQTSFCLFLLGEHKDYQKIISDLPGTFQLHKSYTIKAWGNNTSYELWIFTPKSI